MKNNTRNKKMKYNEYESDISSDQDSEYISEETQKYDLDLKIERKLNKIISKDKIHFKDIDDLKLFKDDKTYLYQLYNIYYFIEENTMEKFELQNKIKKNK